MPIGFIQINRLVSEVEAGVPEQVRKEWIGLILPIESVTTRSVIQKGRTTNYSPVYTVRKEELIEALKERNSRMAKWVRAHQLDVDFYHFSSNSCRVFQGEKVFI